MQKIMLKSKLHRASVTDVLIDYEGSIEIDEDLMDQAGISIHEQVHVFNINNGNRFITYAIPGKRGEQAISINGAAAHLAKINDRIIIVAYGIINDDHGNMSPRILVLDENNQIVSKKGM